NVEAVAGGGKREHAKPIAGRRPKRKQCAVGRDFGDAFLILQEGRSGSACVPSRTSLEFIGPRPGFLLEHSLSTEIGNKLLILDLSNGRFAMLVWRAAFRCFSLW